MLVLSRRLNEKIYIGPDIVLTVVDVRHNGTVRLGFDAPNHVQIYREEVKAKILREGDRNERKPEKGQANG